jgi:hypothetical protein
LDRYFEWRAAVPRQHRNRLGVAGHPCIFQVFEEAYRQLKAAELALSPPSLVLPSPPPTVAGVYLGEIESP